MAKCLKCEHPIELHTTICTDIEGKINGINRNCDCNYTKEINDAHIEKIEKREGKDKDGKK